MQELRRKPDAPFVGASFGPSGFIRDLQVFQVGVSPKEGKGAAAFEAALRELRRFDEHGVLATELERAKASLLRGRESAAAEEGKTESYVYVESYINAFLHGEAPVSARDRYALAKRILPTVTIAEVNAAIREASRGNDRFILVLGPEKAKADLPTRDTLLAILARTDTMTLPAWTETNVATALVPNPPRPGRIVSETTYADIGVTDWRFSNGVRVLIKPTDFKADEIQMRRRGRRRSLAVARRSARQRRLRRRDRAPERRRRLRRRGAATKLSGKIVRVVPAIDETSEGMIAISAPRDLETALQVLWLNATAPRLDTAAVTALTNQVRNGLKNRDAEPGTAFSDTITITLGRNSPRAQPMTAARLDTEFDPRRALALYRDWFHDFGDFTFVVVGNVKVDSLRPLLSQWLGGLPAAGTARTWKDVAPLPPEGLITKMVRKGKEPVAEQVVLFSGPVDACRVGDRTTPPRPPRPRSSRSGCWTSCARRWARPTASMRAPSSSACRESVIARSIEFKSSPQQADTLWSAAQAIIAAFRNDGPQPDEVQKFVAQARRETEVQIKTNDWWLGRLSDYVMPDGGEAGRPISEILQWGQRLDALTPSMIRDAAQRYFDPARVARFVLLPEK